jgi:tRNA (adenine37-N6)-methyltransferase
VNVEPIATVHCARREAQEDGWGAVQSTIVLDVNSIGLETLVGLDGFSHLEVIYVFHRVPPDTVTSLLRHPRGEPNWPRTGVFAQRSPGRPNRIGASICRLDHIRGGVLTVTGLDALDGSPVLDIKPWVVEFGPQGEVSQPAWTHEMLAHYWH